MHGHIPSHFSYVSRSVLPSDRMRPDLLPTAILRRKSKALTFAMVEQIDVCQLTNPAEGAVFTIGTGGAVGKINLRFLPAFLAAIPAAAHAAGPPSCATCAKEVSLSKAEVQCVLDRVGKQLSSALDPVVVATTGCSGKVRDGTRLEAVRQGRKVAKRSDGSVVEPYLLTKSDAQCLVRKLKQVDPKARELRIDLRSCG